MIPGGLRWTSYSYSRVLLLPTAGVCSFLQQGAALQGAVPCRKTGILREWSSDFTAIMPEDKPQDTKMLGIVKK